MDHLQVDFVIRVASAISQIVLALVFLAAGIAKARDVARTQEAIASFGFHRAARWGSVLVPASETLLGVWLLSGLASGAAGWVAVTTLSLFTVLVAGGASRGEAHECNCFGSFSDARVGWPMVYRNLLLLFSAVLVSVEETGWVAGFWRGLAGLAFHDATRAMLSVLIVLCASQLVATSYVVIAIRGRRLALGRNDPVASFGQIQVGQVLPDIAIRDANGRETTLSATLQHGRNALLLFVNGKCKACAAFLPEIPNWRKRLESTDIVVLSRKALDSEYTGGALANVYLYENARLPADLGLMMTPSATLISHDRRRLSGSLLGPAQIKTFLEQHVNSIPAIPESQDLVLAT